VYNEDIKLICTSCGKIEYGDGHWTEPDGTVQSDLVTALCSECSHKRFPHLYSDYEKPEESLGRKILNGLFRWKDINQKN